MLYYGQWGSLNTLVVRGLAKLLMYPSSMVDVAMVTMNAMNSDFKQ